MISTELVSSPAPFRTAVPGERGSPQRPLDRSGQDSRYPAAGDAAPLRRAGSSRTTVTWPTATPPTSAIDPAARAPARRCAGRARAGLLRVHGRTLRMRGSARVRGGGDRGAGAGKTACLIALTDALINDEVATRPSTSTRSRGPIRIPTIEGRSLCWRRLAGPSPSRARPALVGEVGRVERSTSPSCSRGRGGRASAGAPGGAARTLRSASLRASPPTGRARVPPRRDGAHGRGAEELDGVHLSLDSEHAEPERDRRPHPRRTAGQARRIGSPAWDSRCPSCGATATACTIRG